MNCQINSKPNDLFIYLYNVFYHNKFYTSIKNYFIHLGFWGFGVLGFWGNVDRITVGGGGGGKVVDDSWDS